MDNTHVVGNDIRKAVVDGFPVKQAIASDLRPDPSKVDIATELPPLSELTSLAPLLGRLSAIHTSAFFHLFDEAQQALLARKVASLLSAEPGSIIFGAHGGRPEKGYREDVHANPIRGSPMFCHSPETWVELWEKEVFKEGEVRAWATLKEVARPDLVGIPGVRWYLLVWSVTRL